MAAAARACTRGAGAAVVALALLVVAAGHAAAAQSRVAYFADYEERNLCRVQDDCHSSKACLQGRCQDPCREVCGLGAMCRVTGHVPICSCPEGSFGNPFVRCQARTEGFPCKFDSDCNLQNACVNDKCENLCRTSPVCGMNTRCSVTAHRINCRCLEGFYGNPLVACFAQEGNQDGPRCRVDSDCSPLAACRSGQCADPCAAACGANTQCGVVFHSPVCSCAPGFLGNSLTGCTSAQVSSPTTNRPSLRPTNQPPPTSPPPPGSSPIPPFTSPSTPSVAPPPKRASTPSATMVDTVKVAAEAMKVAAGRERAVGAAAGAVGAPNTWLPTLHRACARCLCEAATGCEQGIGCQGGYCGPFGVSRLYWHEAGRPVLPHDDPDRKEAYEDCANIYDCARRIVTEYMLKLAKDCNGDGRVNCDDFALAHHNGGYTCQRPLNRTAEGVKYQKRYLKCRGEDEDDDPLGLAVASS